MSLNYISCIVVHAMFTTPALHDAFGCAGHLLPTRPVVDPLVGADKLKVTWISGVCRVLTQSAVINIHG